MAQLGKVRKQRPEKKRFRVSSSILQWAIVAVVGGAMAFFLVRSLVSKPTDTPPIPFLSSRPTDLGALTRTLGDITLDSAARAAFPAGLNSRLVGVDTLVAQRRFDDAIGLLYRQLKDAEQGTIAAVRAYLGQCCYLSRSADMALMHWRKALAAADTASPALVPWLRFSVGFLFQSHGLPESALVHYRAMPADRSVPSGLGLAAVLNNTGAALEALADTVEAVRLYSSAIAVLDTLAPAQAAKTISDNRTRLAGPGPR
jgi:tetratricopeptide (TPR) repeat protein